MKNQFSFLLLCAFFSISFNGYTQNLYTHSNAAHPTNETNNTNGWNSHGSAILGTMPAISGSTGSYFLTITANANWSRGRYYFNTEIGEQYNISITAKREGSIYGGFYLWEGFSDFTGRHFENNTDWGTYNFTLTADDTSAYIQIYPGGDTTGGPANIGAFVFVDNITITKVGTSTNSVSDVILSPKNVDLEIGENQQINSSISPQNATNQNINWSSSNNAVATVNSSGLVSAVSAGSATIIATKADGGFTDSALITVNTPSGGNTSAVWSEANSTASYVGQVAIGRTTVPTGYKLGIDGKVRAREIRVDQDNWPDYVFKEDYNLPTLAEIQKHIKEKGHLPNIPSAKEVETSGIELGEMNRLLLEKIEELTLLFIEQEQKVQQQAASIKKLQKEIQIITNKRAISKKD